MNALWLTIGGTPGDALGERTERAATARSPLAPYAETRVAQERTLTSMASNNPAGLDLAMPPWPEVGSPTGGVGSPTGGVGSPTGG